MRYPLLFAVLYLLSAACLADVTFKTCSRPAGEHATVTLDDLGAFHITVHVGEQSFVSSACKPVNPEPLPQIGIAGIECFGDWNKGKGSVILDSMDGVLNVLMYKGPAPLPAQYDDDRALLCASPRRYSARRGLPMGVVFRAPAFGVSAALQYPEDDERQDKG